MICSTSSSYGSCFLYHLLELCQHRTKTQVLEAEAHILVSKGGSFCCCLQAVPWRSSPGPELGPSFSQISSSPADLMHTWRGHWGNLHVPSLSKHFASKSVLLYLGLLAWILVGPRELSGPLFPALWHFSILSKAVAFALPVWGFPSLTFPSRGSFPLGVFFLWGMPVCVLV